MNDDKKKISKQYQGPVFFFQFEYNTIKFIYCFLHSRHHVGDTEPNMIYAFSQHTVLFPHSIIDNYISPPKL